MSMSIDVKLTEANGSYNDVWHIAMRKYFIAYLKRNGVSIDKREVNKIVFLAGKNPGVVCYGGGFSRPRITINKDLIKYTLGAISDFNPQETGIFTRKMFQPVLKKNSVLRLWPDISHDNMIKKRQKADTKRADLIAKARDFYESELIAADKKHHWKTENILQGLVLPKLEGVDLFPSLMSDNFDEMQIVEKLLLENAIGYDPYDEEAEIDDASEHDKDFLFGALLHKLGTLLRHEDIFSTLYLYFKRDKKPKQKKPSDDQEQQAAQEEIEEIPAIAKKKSYNFIYSKYFACVADTFVVLNFGLNHFLQHLYYQATEDELPLTTKGETSGMLESQDFILTESKKRLDERARKTMRTDELDRIAWLSRFCLDPIEIQRRDAYNIGLILKALTFVFAFGLVAGLIAQAYQYHPKYLATIAKEKQEIEQAIKDEQEKERHKQ